MVTRLVKTNQPGHKCGLPRWGTPGDIRVCSECGSYYIAKRPDYPPGFQGQMLAPGIGLWRRMGILEIWWHVTRKRRDGRT